MSCPMARLRQARLVLQLLHREGLKRANCSSQYCKNLFLLQHIHSECFQQQSAMQHVHIACRSCIICISFALISNHTYMSSNAC